MPPGNSVGTAGPTSRHDPPPFIRLLHRAPVAFIPLAFKPKEEKWVNLKPVPAADLAERWADLAPRLNADAYYTINSFGPKGRALPPTHLNAVFTDLDCHDTPGRTVADVLDGVRQLVNAGTIPPPSIIVESGRGVWLLWLLVDPVTDLPPEATAERRALYSRVQDAVCGKLADLGADAGAKDEKRFTRVPGSLNSGAGLTVVYSVQYDLTGKPWVYALDTLATAFHVQPEPPRPERPKAVRIGKAGDKPVKRKGRGAWDIYPGRISRLEKLCELRGGGFGEGCRERAAFLCANFYSRAGHPIGTVAAKVRRLAEECRPPLPMAEAENAIKYGPKYRKISNQKIADWMRITPDESEALEPWPYAGFTPPPDPPPRMSRKAAQAARRECIRQIIRENGGELLPIRTVQAKLRERDHSASLRTVHQDLKALDLCQTVEGAGGRK